MRVSFILTVCKHSFLFLVRAVLLQVRDNSFECQPSRRDEGLAANHISTLLELVSLLLQLGHGIG